MISPITKLDPDWGCDHLEFGALSTGNIRACRVSVSDIRKLALALNKVVVETSWMSDLDEGARLAYETTAQETANLLVTIFKAAETSSSVKEDFGELMVSMGSARALNMLFKHREVPLAELWKPQLKQNEGFDFHTVCPSEWIHFGEAKYSSSGSPHGLAISQISEFLTAKKHHRDWPHLKSLVNAPAVAKLVAGEFGVVAAFSLNAKSPEIVIKNAIESAKELAKSHKIQQIFLVGVSDDS